MPKTLSSNSAEEDTLSTFDSITLPCSQCIKINTNKCMCMYVCIHTHKYIQTCMHACIHAYMHACIHTYIHACMHTYIHIYIHTYIRMFDLNIACLCQSIEINNNKYVCVRACVRGCVRAFVHACMHVCMYVCVIVMNILWHF